MNWVLSVDWFHSMQRLIPAHRLLGQVEGTEVDGEGVAAPAKGAAPGSLTEVLLSPFNFMLMIFVLFFLIVLWPQQRQMRAQQRILAEALANLKKNDRVVTSGGIHGAVVQTSPESGTVTIRIDEATGSKMTVSRDAIARVITAETKTTGNEK